MLVSLSLRHLAMVKEFTAQEEAPSAACEGRTGLMASTVCRALSSSPSKVECVAPTEDASPCVGSKALNPL